MTRNQIAYWELQETKRTNRAKEAETHRSNTAQEKETNRSNLAREAETNRANLAREKQAAIDSNRNYQLGLANLAEVIRNNTENQRLRSKELDEQVRHSKVAEAQNATQLLINQYDSQTRRLGHLETVRSNLAREGQNYLSYRETQLNNQRQFMLGKAQLVETRRANQAREQYNFSSLEETKRSNVRNESLKSYANYTSRISALETKRHNAATEKESERHNRTTEVISGIDVGSKMANSILSTLAKVM